MSEVAFPGDLLGQALLRAATDANLGIVISEVVGNQLNAVYTSPEICRILGRTRAELQAEPNTLKFVAPEEIPRIAQMQAGRIRGEKYEPFVETAVVRPDGTRVPVAIASQRLELEGKHLTVSFVFDNTSRKLTEEKLRTEQERMRKLIEAAPDGIVISRRGGDAILYANRAAALLLGYESGAELATHSLSEFLPADEVARMRETMIKVAVRGEPSEPTEYRATAKDGTQVIAEISSSPFEHEGQPAIVGFARDVSDRARLREQLMRADRLAALGTLAAGVAHEINNPLTAAGLNLELLERKIGKLQGNTEEVAHLSQLTRELRAANDRVAAIVRDLRAFSRADDAGTQAVDLARVMLAAERMAAHATRHLAKISTQLNDLPWVVGTPGRLEQVLVNLLVNAAQAFESHRPENEIKVLGRTDGDDHVVLEVRDNGRGIAPEHLPHIFDPFFTTKPVGVGTGLGLAICQSIISGYGGELTADSTLGEGTTMRLKLERARLVTPSKGRPAVGAQPLRAKLLLIDDEQALARSLALLLNENHDVLAMSEPTQALQLLLDGATFDLVLCDLMMPQLSGMELYHRAAAARPAVAKRFIFMTGGVFGPEAEQFLEKVSNPRLAKPFPVEQLETMIQRVLGSF